MNRTFGSRCHAFRWSDFIQNKLTALSGKNRTSNTRTLVRLIEEAHETTFGPTNQRYTPIRGAILSKNEKEGD